MFEIRLILNTPDRETIIVQLIYFKLSKLSFLISSFLKIKFLKLAFQKDLILWITSTALLVSKICLGNFHLFRHIESTTFIDFLLLS